MNIGIIGGGQLGMMMAMEANQLYHKVISLDPNPNASIVRYAHEHIAKDYNDPQALEYLNQTCDVITYEFENVDLDILKNYINKIPQKLEALRISRNRLIEKKYAQSLGLNTPKFNEVKTTNDLFYPAITKTVTGGYDGKGQYQIMDKSDIDQFEINGDISYICEEYIAFDYEISIVATRDQFNQITYYPTPINKHLNGILHTSIVEDNIPVHIVSIAQDYTRRILEDLEYVGTLAVEFFVVKDDVVFNEFAPRPHNSGHYTINGCDVSQFKNHILAITGDHIQVSNKISNTIMINVLGQNHNYYNLFKEFDTCTIQDYYKNSDRHNRKIGHINCLYNDERDLQIFLDVLNKENKNE
jgi:5-(carboxyamino)imidazole ribonucleotide synthase